MIPRIKKAGVTWSPKFAGENCPKNPTFASLPSPNARKAATSRGQVKASAIHAILTIAPLSLYTHVCV